MIVLREFITVTYLRKPPNLTIHLLSIVYFTCIKMAKLAKYKELQLNGVLLCVAEQVCTFFILELSAED